MPFFVYILKSQSTKKTYIGQTSNLIKRILRHNQKLPTKKTSYTTKNKGPWIVIYKESFNTRKEATKREKYLKSYRGRQFIKETLGP